MLDEGIRHAVRHHSDGGIETTNLAGHVSAKAVHDRSLLDNENVPVVRDNLRQHRGVVWLEESAIYHSRTAPPSGEKLRRGECWGDHRADRKYGHTGARFPSTRSVLHNFPRAVRHRFDLRNRRDDVRRCIARIAERKWPALVR